MWGKGIILIVCQLFPGFATFVAGLHCAADDMLPMYIDYIKAKKHNDLTTLRAKRWFVIVMKGIYVKRTSWLG